MSVGNGRKRSRSHGPCASCGALDHVECCLVCASKVPAKRRGLQTCSVVCERSERRASSIEGDRSGLRWSDGERCWIWAWLGYLRAEITPFTLDRAAGKQWRWSVWRGGVILESGTEHRNALQRAKRRAEEEMMKHATEEDRRIQAEKDRIASLVEAARSAEA